MKNRGKISNSRGHESCAAQQGILSFPGRSEVAAAATSRGLPQRRRPAARILALSCGAPVGKAN